ncbi:MFS transporter, DHA1 family, multidrug resistance protein, partial [Phenoliferia sp. Uapishka_3]
MLGSLSETYGLSKLSSSSRLVGRRIENDRENRRILGSPVTILALKHESTPVICSPASSVPLPRGLSSSSVFRSSSHVNGDSDLLASVELSYQLRVLASSVGVGQHPPQKAKTVLPLRSRQILHSLSTADELNTRQVNPHCQLQCPTLSEKLLASFAPRHPRPSCSDSLYSLSSYTVGKLLHYFAKGRILKYPEERSNFVIPERYLLGYKSPADDTATLSGAEAEANKEQREAAKGRSTGDLESNTENGGAEVSKEKSEATMHGDSPDLEANREKGEAVGPPSAAVTPQDGIVLVHWYSDDDPDDPQNWSSAKKAFVTAIICTLTFSVYVGSSLITSGFPSLTQHFGIPYEEATVTLSIYVLAYGLGALFFSPLSEIPALGRNPFYWALMLGMVAFQAGAATTPTFTGLVLLRALTAFTGSPVLSTGGATLGDMYKPIQLPIVFSIWVLPAFSAPAVGPVFGNFAAQANGWRWTMWELLWIIGFVTIFLVFFLPETSQGNILLRRAERLRTLTGNKNLRSQSEIDQGEKTPGKVLSEALYRPIEITVKDPSIAFANLYISLIYAFYYLFFEAFPIVYGEIFAFNYGEQGLVYLSIAIGGTVGAIFYVGYQFVVMNPYYAKKGWPVNEKRLEPALVSAVLAPIGLWIFAWTSRTNVHWIGSLIGVGLFVAANFATLQCVFLYIVLSYPQYAASLLAGNDAFRSITAAAFLHAGTPMFRAMKISGGVSFLAGLTMFGIPGIWAIWYYGAMLREKSRFAVGDAKHVVEVDVEPAASAPRQ